MFYLTFNKKRTLIILLVVNIILISLVVFMAVGAITKRLDSFKTRKEYLENLGYSIDNSFTEEIKIIVLPTSFSKVYLNYNEFQKQNGFNLEKYKGFQITQYTLKVFDDTKRDDLYAHILLHNGRLIGGDIATTAIDGYMKGLKNASW